MAFFKVISEINLQILGGYGEGHGHALAKVGHCHRYATSDLSTVNGQPALCQCFRTHPTHHCQIHLKYHFTYRLPTPIRFHCLFNEVQAPKPYI